ncbi:MAG TPA: DUF2384 domain-containing protein [Holophaga sp.]|nr:DUF2384 domain-containing protein [Holophaga sp.]
MTTSQEGGVKQDRIAMKAVVAMAEILELSEKESGLLFGLPAATLRQWVKCGPALMTPVQRRRIGIILTIYQLAGTAFPGGGGAKGWLTRPNAHPALANRRPLDVMLSNAPEGLELVLNLLHGIETFWS